MFNAIGRLLFVSASHDTPVLDSFYGWDITPDPDAVAKREAMLSKVKKQMGNKYVLATPVVRK